MTLFNASKAYASITNLDWSNETTVTRVPIATLDDTASNAAAVAAAVAALEDAVNDVAYDNIRKISISFDEDALTPPAPYNDRAAQRENKVLVRAFNTNTGDKISFSIGMVNFASITLLEGSDDLDLDSMAAWVTKLETALNSGSGQSYWQIYSATYVGRNS